MGMPFRSTSYPSFISRISVCLAPILHIGRLSRAAEEARVVVVRPGR